MSHRVLENRKASIGQWALRLLAVGLIASGCNRDAGSKADAGGDVPKDQHKDEVKLTAEAIKKYGIIVEPVKKQVLIPTFSAPGRVSFNMDAMAHVGRCCEAGLSI